MAKTLIELVLEGPAGLVRVRCDKEDNDDVTYYVNDEQVMRFTTADMERVLNGETVETPFGPVAMPTFMVERYRRMKELLGIVDDLRSMLDASKAAVEEVRKEKKAELFLVPGGMA